MFEAGRQASQAKQTHLGLSVLRVWVLGFGVSKSLRLNFWVSSL